MVVGRKLSNQIWEKAIPWDTDQICVMVEDSRILPSQIFEELFYLLETTASKRYRKKKNGT